MAQATILSSPELVEELAKIAVYPSREDFSQIGSSFAYNTPLRVAGEFSANGIAYVNSDGAIVQLNLSEQVMFLQLLSEKSGLLLRHGSLREQLRAAYSPQGLKYKQNVLDHFLVYTGEMFKIIGDEYGIGKVIDVRLVSAGVSDDHAVFEGEDAQKNHDLVVIRYNLGPILQTEIPMKTGYFDKISGVVPVDREIKIETGRGKGYWTDVYFDSDSGLSAVWCTWDSDKQWLDAGADEPLDRSVGGAVGTWTDTPLNK